MRVKQSVLITGNDGPPCPSCGKPTQIRKHKTIRARELKRPFYYSRWYFCVNSKCVTSTILPSEFRVFAQAKSDSHNLGDLSNECS